MKRYYKTIGVLILISCVFGITRKVPNNLVQEPLQVKTLVICNNEGRPRMYLTAKNDNPMIFIMNKEGKNMLGLGYDSKMSSMMLMDSKGHARIALIADDKEPRISILNTDLGAVATLP